ncbi:hypothetical protein [Actinophytocola algeriensis]|uniref:Integral membrane protein n=1 Tax=Actinophytocola algeriensis TaxID=1768010 RepID=A0A7W7VBT5_9PSEU|nr:hypothetical protein [Actinophytocola algeriensis]MBB4904364.1 hypothetical protein [Actinophytocola algeriensis]MBE1476778.1 hypothetical protein [Actinophytocola algeriensis]
MIEILAAVLTYVALAAAVWAAVLVVVGKPIQLREWHGLWLYGVVLLLEVGLLVQLVAGIVRLATADRQVDSLAYLGYLITALLIPPLAGFWALAERSRWGPAVMVVGCLTVPVLILRLGQVWDAHV